MLYSLRQVIKLCKTLPNNTLLFKYTIEVLIHQLNIVHIFTSCLPKQSHITGDLGFERTTKTYIHRLKHEFQVGEYGNTIYSKTTLT